MQAVILAGGLGSRLQEETSVKPKPMVEIGGRPMLWHIMKIYATYGIKEFCVALGYKGELIKNFFLNYYHLQNDLTVHLDQGRVEVHDEAAGHTQPSEDWKVHLVDTGLGTQTGGRIKRLAPWLRDQTFCMTYGDGVADVNISRLLEFHKAHGKLATVTVARPPARFGSLQFEGDRILDFSEKPQTGEGWINGGFFILEPGILDYIEGDETDFSSGPLEKLVEEQQLVAYKHEGFWQCMDTLRDLQLLENLWHTGKAPWKKW
ncbi:glucose-1-phosphate cytidylyltransferase [bacterium]|nr:glucose-1-phosphate cytidylyltransferase [bacterium]